VERVLASGRYENIDAVLYLERVACAQIRLAVKNVALIDFEAGPDLGDWHSLGTEWAQRKIANAKNDVTH
jgi:hypothetical protein